MNIKRIVVGSIVVEESHAPSGIRLGTVHGNHVPDHVERGDISDLYEALRQYITLANRARGSSYTPDIKREYGRRDGSDSEVDRIARLLIAAWEKAEGGTVNPSFIATFADLARAVVADRDLPSANAAIAEGQAIEAWHTTAVDQERGTVTLDKGPNVLRLVVHQLNDAIGQHHRGSVDHGIRTAIALLEKVIEVHGDPDGWRERVPVRAASGEVTLSPDPVRLGVVNVESVPPSSSEAETMRRRLAAALDLSPDSPGSLFDEMLVRIAASNRHATAEEVYERGRAAGAAQSEDSRMMQEPAQLRSVVAQRMLVLADQRAQAGDHIGACECVGAYYTLLALACPLLGAR